MNRREKGVTALVAVCLAALIAANVRADSERRTQCHANLTCDGPSMTCYAIDGAHECARKVERVDARGAVYMEIAGARGYYASMAECQEVRGVVVHVGGTAGECSLASFPAVGGGK